jgi:hypothetical protein
MTMAPGVLKPIIIAAGKSCLAVDVGTEVYIWQSALPESADIYDEFLNGCIYNESMLQAYRTIAEQIVSWTPEYVGISLLTYASQQSAEIIATHIRELAPSAKIIFGGSGCLQSVEGGNEFITGAQNKNLVDYHIRGNGEQPLYELLTGNADAPGINSVTWKRHTREDLNNALLPDYSDYVLPMDPAIPVIGAQGCMKKCKFCDYIAYWPSYHWRDADKIFNEAKANFLRYGARTVIFHDTLVNGNQDEFGRLLALFKEWNEANPSSQLRWWGYYLFRNKTHKSDAVWKALSQSGALRLLVGIENLNSDIRRDIGKTITDEAIEYHLEQALKYNIKLKFLCIVGWPTETYDHILKQKKWMDDHLKYKSILRISWGDGLSVFDGSWIANNKDEAGITMTGPNPKDFKCANHDFSVRQAWVNELVEHSRSLGYDVYTRMIPKRRENK